MDAAWNDPPLPALAVAVGSDGDNDGPTPAPSPNNAANVGGVNPDDILFASNRANSVDTVSNNDCVCAGTSERSVSNSVRL